MGSKDLSPMPNLPKQKSFNRWRAFEKIKCISRLSDKVKIELFETYENFINEEFTKIEYHSQMDYYIGNSGSKILEHQLKKIDELFCKMK